MIGYRLGLDQLGVTGFYWVSLGQLGMSDVATCLWVAWIGQVWMGVHEVTRCSFGYSGRVGFGSVCHLWLGVYRRDGYVKFNCVTVVFPRTDVIPNLSGYSLFNLVYWFQLGNTWVDKYPYAYIS